MGNEFAGMALRIPASIGWRCGSMFLCFAVLLPSCSSSSRHSSPQTTVTILCASSALPAFKKVAESYESAPSGAKTGIEISIVSGPSNILAQQILAGASADIFLSANTEWACKLEQSDCVSGRVTLLSNRLVLVVPRGNPRGVNTLADLGLQEGLAVAIGGKHVPLGIYTDQSLWRLNLLKAISEESDVIRTANARATLALVERGEVDAAIVYESDAQSSKLVDIVEQIPAELHEEIVYPLLLLNYLDPDGSGDAAAREFFDYLATTKVKALFEEFGFVNRLTARSPPAPTPPDKSGN